MADDIQNEEDLPLGPIKKFRGLGDGDFAVLQTRESFERELSETGAVADRLNILDENVLLTSPLYDTVAAGLAATIDDAQFKVKSDNPGLVAYFVYQNVSGSGVLISEVPAGNALGTKQPIGTATIAAAATTDIGALNASYVVVEGIADITSLGNALPGTRKVLRCASTPKFVHGSSLVLFNKVDYTATANSSIEFQATVSDIATVWRQLLPSKEQLSIPLLSVDADFSSIATGAMDAERKIVWGFDKVGVSLDEAETRLDDEFTNLVVGHRDSGSRIANASAVNKINSDPTRLLSPTKNGVEANLVVRTDWNHFIGAGQSLASRYGANLNEDVSKNGYTNGSGNVYTFSGGNGFDLDPEQNGVSFGPLSDDPAVASAHGIYQAAMIQMDFMIHGSSAFDGDPSFTGTYQSVYSGKPYAGQSIENLSSGGTTNSFDATIHQISEAVSIAQASGESYKVQAFSWMQGEGNWNDDAATYKAKFNSLIADYDAQVSALVGQARPFDILVYQTSSLAYPYTAGELWGHGVNQAFFDLMIENPRIVVATPTYFVPHWDAYHPSAAANVLLGAQWGKVQYKRVFRGEDWLPLMPVLLSQSGPRVVTVKFHVPEGPLQFDTDTVVDPGDYGFVVEDDDGFVGISSVEIVRPDTIRIVTDADIGANGKVSYAYYGVGGQWAGPNTGARGCLKDSDATVAKDGEQPLNNWCVSFILATDFVAPANFTKRY